MSLKSLLISGLLLVNVGVCAAPQDKLLFSVGLSYENSDNINLSPSNKRSENIGHTLFATEYQRQSAKLQASFNLSADYQKYQNHTFSDQTTVSSYLSFYATLEKQRVFWSVDNRFDRVQINQTQLNIPTNQENTNYFTTGPKFIFIKNNKDSLDADIKYEKFYTEISNNDYYGYIANVSYLRNISHTLATGLNARYNKRNFDNKIVNSDFSRTDVTINLSKRTKLSRYGVVVGKTQLILENQPSNQENIFRANYQSQLGRQTNLSIDYSRELSDFSTMFAATIPGDSTYTDVNSATFLASTGRFSVIRNFSNTNLRFDYTYASNDYTDNTLDLITRTSTITLNNNIRNGMTLNLMGLYRNRGFARRGRVDLSRVYAFGITQRFLNLYDLAFNIQYTNNGSTDSNLNYDERRIKLSGHYYFR